MKIRILILTVLLTIPALFNCKSAQAGSDEMEVRLVSVNKILSACKIQKFSTDNDTVQEINFSDNSNIRTIEGNKTTIDTQEEFLTAAYYNIKILPGEAQKVISAELPAGKEGALRLSAMWLTKLAENPENGLQYNKAIDLIIEKSSIDRESISNYYARSMQKKIYAMPLGEPLTDDEQKKAKELLLAYMVKPTTANAKAFKTFKFNLGISSPTKAVVISAFVKQVSEKVNSRLV